MSNGEEEEEEAILFSRTTQINSGTILGMVMKAAIELNLFEIMAKVCAVNGTSTLGDDATMLSCDEIVAHFSATNPTAPAVLDRILKFLASKSVLNRTIVVGEDGKDKDLYGLSPICKYYISDEDGVSLATSLLVIQDKVVIDSWYHLKDAVTEGGIPFNKAHGMHAFEYPAKDSRFNKIFNEAMHNNTTIIMKKVLEVYFGFKGITEIVDVGGGTEATLAQIISKYPQIRGTNFDLPHVVDNASPLADVEYIGGDMFESVPKGQTIFMKAWKLAIYTCDGCTFSILHDWSDEQCIKILQNCWNALPDTGKVIVVEGVLPEYTNKMDTYSKDYVIDADMVMLALTHGGKERSLREFEELGKQSGFLDVKFICNASISGVLEFYKK